MNDDDLKEHYQVIKKEREKAKRIGYGFWVVFIAVGLLGWIFWKWYVFLIALVLSIIAGSIYSYRKAKIIQKKTGLNIRQQEAVFTIGRESH